MSAWDELKKINEEIELRKLVREFVKKELEEAMGSNSSEGQGEAGGPEESEVEETY